MAAQAPTPIYFVFLSKNKKRQIKAPSCRTERVLLEGANCRNWDIVWRFNARSVRTHGRMRATPGSALSQIDRAHIRISTDLIGRAGRQDPPVHQYRYRVRKTKYQIHVVLDQQHTDVVR